MNIWEDSNNTPKKRKVMYVIDLKNLSEEYKSLKVPYLKNSEEWKKWLDDNNIPYIKVNV